MKIHGTIISPNVRKVLAVLNIKGLKYEKVHVIPGTQTPEYLAISPRGHVPAFEDGDFNTPDSQIIVEYLDEQYSKSPVMPLLPKERAKSRWLTEYAGSVAFPCCATIFRECVLKPNFIKEAKNKSLVEEVIKDKFPPILNYLESQVPDEGFFFGDIGVVDVSIVSPLINAEYGDYYIDAKTWPKLADFVYRVKTHAAFKMCIEDEKIILTLLKS